MATFSPAADFADVVDGLEAVTLLRRGSSTTVAVTHALERQVTTREAAASYGKYTQADVTWHLPAEECASAPLAGDQILDGDGVRWTILEVRKSTLGTRWACVCRDLVVAYGLNDTVAILKASYAKGTGGAQEPTWLAWKTGVRARVQPERAEVAVELGARRTAERFLIYIAEDVQLDHSCRVQDEAGAVYKIVAIRAREDIGGYTTIEAERTPWPAN